MQILWAKKALTAQGWQGDVCVTIDDHGLIVSVRAGAKLQGQKFGILLPAPANLHSHAFQRAMAGMSEARGPKGADNFWTWRSLMFRFVAELTPDDVAAIAAFVQMEMLEAGYAASCEFHYVHHHVDGTPYDNIAQMSAAVATGAEQSGIGLTLLPVLYQFGGCDARPLAAGQVRFGNFIDQFAKLFDAAKTVVAQLGNHANIGVAPHSLRATDKQGLDFTAQLAPDAPIHIHLAEQRSEVDHVLSHLGARPVEWLLGNFDVDPRWCLIHLTHMTAQETIAVAKSGAVAGLCPLTESSLGDGIFNGKQFLGQGGRFGIGSDSNIRISLVEELRTLEYSQRLRDQQRAVLATDVASTGRVLFDGMLQGGAQAAGRNCGVIEVGKIADLMALDSTAVDLFRGQDDDLLDSYIFAGSDQMVRDVWSGGRHLVKDGAHIWRAAITERYKKTLSRLKAQI